MNISDEIARIYYEGDLLLGSILTYLPNVESTQIPTAAVALDEATKKVSLMWNREFFSGLTGAERRDVLRHEAMHIAFFHLFRINDRDGRRWNIAADMFINQHLRNLPDGGVELPEGWERNLSADEYYSLLEQNPEEEEKYSGSETDCHEGWDDIVGDEQVQAELSDAVKDLAERASQAGDKMGQRAISAFPKKPSREWASEIRKMFSPTEAEVLYKTNRFDRRRTYHNGQEMIPARLNKPHCPKIYVAIDTSGSISEDMFEKFAGEINQMARYANIETIIFDHGIQARFPWKRNKSVEMVGGGGTSFQEVFDEVSKDKECGGVIVLTDGWADKPELSSKVKTLWVLTKSNNPSVKDWFGKSTTLDY